LSKPWAFAQAAACTAAERIVVGWNDFASRLNPVLTLVGTCTVLTGPLIFFRGYNSDEGLAVSIARTALEDGKWLVPHVFNLRWVERPTLLSWIIAAISEPTGNVTQVTARLPIALFFFFGCFLIYRLLRRVAATVPAALFGVALFVACPLVIRSSIMITADLPLAITLSFALYLWWGDNEAGTFGMGRWLVIGVILAIAGLFKGSQPIAYFALGVGLYILCSRSWRQIPWLILAGVICAIPLALWYAAVYRPGDTEIWATFMRIHPAQLFSSPPVAIARTFGETLPAALAAAVFGISIVIRGQSRRRPNLALALACYVFPTAALVLFWPGGSTRRYYFPLVLPLCIFGGLGYDMLSEKWPQIVAPIMVLTAALLAYAIVYSLASPFLPQRYRQAWLDAERITAAMQSAPEPIYRAGDTGLNILAYVPGKVLIKSLDELTTVPAPAWMLLPIDDAAVLLARRPNTLNVVMTVGNAKEWDLLRLDRPN
jgi:4-amino-4-deoxy-L-arabinose transferase-like glycosyltransferase